MEHCGKKNKKIPTKGIWVAGSHIQRQFILFLIIKRQIKNCCIKNLNSIIWLRASSICGIFFGKQIKISIFGGIPKFLKLIVFGQNLAKFGSFRHFMAVALAMVKNMLKARLKS